MIYGVTNWRTLYENADTRRRKNLGWVLTPNRHDSMAFGTLMAKGSEGLQIFGVWMVLLQLSSRGPYEYRGILCDSDGNPYSLEAMAVKTRVLISDLEKAIPVLVDLGWMYGENTPINSIYGKSDVLSVDSDVSSVDPQPNSVGELHAAAESCSKYKRKQKRKHPPIVWEDKIQNLKTKAIPEHLQTECFQEAWEKWIKHLDERFGGASPTQLESHLAELQPDSPEIAAERLLKAINLGFRMPCDADKVSAPPPELPSEVMALAAKIRKEFK